MGMTNWLTWNPIYLTMEQEAVLAEFLPHEELREGRLDKYWVVLKSSPYEEDTDVLLIGPFNTSPNGEEVFAIQRLLEQAVGKKTWNLVDMMDCPDCSSHAHFGVTKTCPKHS